MKGNILALSNTWTVGDLLGGGGYGRVYELVGGDRQAVAKFVPRAPWGVTLLVDSRYQEGTTRRDVIETQEVHPGVQG